MSCERERERDDDGTGARERTVKESCGVMAVTIVAPPLCMERTRPYDRGFRPSVVRVQFTTALALSLAGGADGV
jgi:hypothetical protein